MVRRLCLVAVLIATAAVAFVAPAYADPPSSVRDLPGLGPGATFPSAHLLIDRAHGQILVSGKGGLAVAPVDGSAASQVGSPDVVGGLALSTDKATLWYADMTNGALVAIDAASVNKATPVSYPLPDGVCPSELAVDGTDRVWFLYYSCATHSAGGLGVYEAGTGFDLHPSVESQIPDLGLLDLLENNPATPNIIVAASDSRTTTIDVSTSTVHADTAAPSGSGGLAVTSDGTKVLRSARAVELLPTGDPVSTSAAASFDPSPMGNPRDEKAAVAVSGDDADAAAVYGSDIVSFGTASGNQTWIRRCEGAQDVAALAWDGPDVWFVRDNSHPMQLGRCDEMTTPESFIGGTGPGSVTAGRAFASPVTLSYRNVPLAGASLTVSRDGRAMPSLITDAKGGATLTDTPLAGTHTYVISYGGDVQHPPNQITLSSTASRLPSRIDDLQPSTRHVIVGNPVSFSARSVPGARIHIVRIDARGRHALADVITGSDGSFTISDRPPVGGNAEYDASFAGDDTYLPSSTEPFFADVSRLASTVSIKLDHPALYYNSVATVHVHLGPTYNSRTVTLWAHIAGVGVHRVIAAKVDRNGNLTARTRVARNTIFTASFKGDDHYAPKSVSVTEYAAVRTSLQLGDQYKTLGKFHLFHTTTQVKLIGTVLPARAGQCLQFATDHRVGNRWVFDGYSPCAPTNRYGRGVMYFLPKKPVLNVVYRFQSFYQGDSIHSGSDSVIRYGKFTN
jgi:hypothetical protein